MSTADQAGTIEQVITRLDGIIDETVRENNYLGIFAYVYKRTTEGVRDAILKGRFEDNERMERMDVAFANLYIRAYEHFISGGEVSRAWQASFDARKDNITIIQHLLLGMNAHINLDLGQAAAATCPGNEIRQLKHDFMEINKVLAELTNVMQRKLGSISPFMVILDWAGKRSDELLVNFSMVKAREQAWRLAEDLALADDEKSRQERLRQADENVSWLSGVIRKPPGRLLPLLLSIIRIPEQKQVGRIIERLDR